MRTPLSRLVIGAAALLAAFAAGVAFEHFGRDAHAESMTTVSTLYVPPGGLVFRSMDGSPIARLSRGPHGGTLEMYDDRREVAERYPASPRGVPALVRENPYAGDEKDPWMPDGPGF